MKVDYKKSVVGVAFMLIIVSFIKVGFELKTAHMQGWEKSIVIDIRLRYSLLFVHRIH